MTNPQRRHDISDAAWALLGPHLPRQSGQWGGVAKDNRLFINAVFWILRTGASWRDLPPEYGKWETVHQRFIRWRDKRIRETLLEILIDDPDFEWLMIDASHCKVHSHAAGGRGSNQSMDRTKRGLTVKYTCRGCAWYAGQYLLADRGYDSNEIIDKAIKTGCKIVIPPKRNRKTQRCYDKALYRVRHLVENAFLHLKRWRGIATRYAKMLTSFEAAVQIRCIAIWLKVLT